jgi:ATP-dependent RNA helicase RhlE
VHRIGRTARAGAEGIAISFCDAEEKAFIRDIEKLIGQPIPLMRDQPYHSDNVEHSRALSSGKAKAAIEGRRGGPGGGGGGGKRPFKRFGRSSGGAPKPAGGSGGGGGGSGSRPKPSGGHGSGGSKPSGPSRPR